MRPDRASMCRLPGGCNVIPAAAFGLLGVAYPVGGTLAVYLGAVALDATGSCAPLIPVILGFARPVVRRAMDRRAEARPHDRGPAGGLTGRAVASRGSRSRAACRTYTRRLPRGTSGCDHSDGKQGAEPAPRSGRARADG